MTILIITGFILGFGFGPEIAHRICKSTAPAITAPVPAPVYWENGTAISFDEIMTRPTGLTGSTYRSALLPAPAEEARVRAGIAAWPTGPRVFAAAQR